MLRVDAARSYQRAQYLPMLRIIYVSVVARTDDAKRVVEHIVQQSLVRNPAVGVTGVLLCTGLHFAQAIEGPDTAVEDLYTSICSDKRHESVRLVDKTEISRRSFASWSLAYRGNATYVDRPIENYLAGSYPRDLFTAHLLRLMIAFAGEPE